MAKKLTKTSYLNNKTDMLKRLDEAGDVSSPGKTTPIKKKPVVKKKNPPKKDGVPQIDPEEMKELMKSFGRGKAWVLKMLKGAKFSK